MSNNRVHHFKLVLLGDTAVGKSCLVVRFVRDEFFEFQEPTIGGKHTNRLILAVMVTWTSVETAPARTLKLYQGLRKPLCTLDLFFKKDIK